MAIFGQSAGSAAQGLLQGIMYEAEKRRQHKADILSAIMQNPDAAISIFGNEINKVSNVNTVRQYADKLEQNKRLEQLLKVDPNIVANMNGAALTPESYLEGTSNLYKTNRKDFEDKTKFDQDIAITNTAGTNPLSASGSDNPALANAAKPVLDYQKELDDRKQQIEDRDAYNNVLKLGVGIDPNFARDYFKTIDTSQPFEAQKQNIETLFKNYGVVGKINRYGNSYVFEQINPVTKSVVSSQQVGQIYPSGGSGGSGGRGGSETTEADLNTWYQSIGGANSGWKIGIKGYTATGKPNYVMSPTRAPMAKNGIVRLPDNAYQTLAQNSAILEPYLPVGYKGVMPESAYDKLYAEKQQMISNNVVRQIKLSKKKMIYADDLDTSLRKEFNEVDPKAGWLNNDKTVNMKDIQELRNAYKRYYYNVSTPYGADTSKKPADKKGDNLSPINKTGKNPPIHVPENKTGKKKADKKTGMASTIPH